MLKIFNILFIIVFLVFGILFFTVKSQTFKNFALSKFYELFEEKTGEKIEIEEIEYQFPFFFELKNISTSHLFIDQLEASFSLKKLLKGEIEISSLNIQQVNIAPFKNVEEGETLKSSEIKKLLYPVLFSFLNDSPLKNWSIRSLKIEDKTIQMSGRSVKKIKGQEIDFNLTDSNISSEPLAGSLFLNNSFDGIEGKISISHTFLSFESLLKIETNGQITFLNLHGFSADLFQNHSSPLFQYSTPRLKLSLFPFLIEGKIKAEAKNLKYGELKTRGKISLSAIFSTNEKEKQQVKLFFRSPQLQKEKIILKNPFLKVLIQDLFDKKEVRLSLVVEKAIIEDSLNDLSLNKIKLTGSYNKEEQIVLKGHIRSLPARDIYKGAADGSIDLEVTVDGSLKNPNCSINAEVKGLRLSDKKFEKLGYLSGNCKILIVQEKLSLTGVLKDKKGRTSFFDGEIPILFSIVPPSFAIQMDEPLSGNCHFNGDVGDLIQLLSETPPQVYGETNLGIEVIGTFANPHFKGFCKIKEATFEIPETGLLYQDLSADFTSFDSQVTLTKLKAKDPFQGIIEGEGFLLLNQEKNFPFELNLQLTNTIFLKLDYADAAGTGVVKLKGDLNSANFSGKLLAEEVSIELPEESSETVLTVDVIYKNKKENSLLETKKNESSWPIYLDLDFEINKPFSIKGKDLKSKWNGSLKVAGDSVSPELFGEFKLLKGQYKYRGKILELVEGNVTFSGDPSKKTALYIVGSQEIGDTKIDVILKGALKEPAISFRSNPPLSQREIISYILFGHGVETLNSFEGTELNKSIKDLTKGSKSSDPFTKIRDKIGIDTIDINKSGEAESNEVSIKVGKYVSRGILVSVNKSITAEAYRLSVEAKLFKNIKVEAEIGDNKAGQLNLKWKVDY